MKIRTKKDRRVRIQFRQRKRITGTAERPRLAVFRSNKHIAAQLIDDRAGVTLAAASSTEASLRGSADVETAGKVGELLAERGKAAGIDAAVFDRGGFKYHGRVAALAEAARKGGLEF